MNLNVTRSKIRFTDKRFSWIHTCVIIWLARLVHVSYLPNVGVTCVAHLRQSGNSSRMTFRIIWVTRAVHVCQRANFWVYVWLCWSYLRSTAGDVTGWTEECCHGAAIGARNVECFCVQNQQTVRKASSRLLDFDWLLTPVTDSFLVAFTHVVHSRWGRSTWKHCRLGLVKTRVRTHISTPCIADVGAAIVVCQPYFLSAHAQQQLLKSSPEVVVTEAVDDGVTHGVPVLKPLVEWQQLRRDLGTNREESFLGTQTECEDKIQSEKWRPAQHKKSDDYSHRCCYSQIL